MKVEIVSDLVKLNLKTIEVFYVKIIKDSTVYFHNFKSTNFKKVLNLKNKIEKSEKINLKYWEKIIN